MGGEREGGRGEREGGQRGERGGERGERGGERGEREREVREGEREGERERGGGGGEGGGSVNSQRFHASFLSKDRDGSATGLGLPLASHRSLFHSHRRTLEIRGEL